MSTKIVFCRVDDPYGYFSNFSPHPIFLDETTWPTVEHYFQSQKFTDGKYRSQIQMAKSPMMAVELGCSGAQPIRGEWDTVKDDVIRKAVRAKVDQHADVRSMLLETGKADIAHHDPNDSYWGYGDDGTGKNRLGKIWMEIRTELTKDGPFNEMASPMPPPWLQHPDIKRRSIGWRMGRGEDYMVQWGPWFKGLSSAGRSQYQALYPEPEEWKGFYG